MTAIPCQYYYDKVTKEFNPYDLNSVADWQEQQRDEGDARRTRKLEVFNRRIARMKEFGDYINPFDLEQIAEILEPPSHEDLD